MLTQGIGNSVITKLEDRLRVYNGELVGWLGQVFSSLSALLRLYRDAHAMGMGWDHPMCPPPGSQTGGE